MGCLRPKELRLVRDPINRLLQRYVFPVQFCLGALGNVLNLCVLSGDPLPNTASDLLAAVSFCDLAFLVSMLPHCLSSYDALAYYIPFRRFYLKSRQHIAAVANWMSAAAIWLILAVSIERFLIVRRPLRSKLYWQRGRMVLMLSAVFFATGLLTLYHHFEYDCELVSFCNDTQLLDFCYPSSEKHPERWDSPREWKPSEMKRAYMRVSTFFNAVLIVFAPILLVVLLNVLMIRALNSQTKNMKSMSVASRSGGATRNNQRQRTRVTLTVIAIGSCFSLTHAPSAVMAIWELVVGYDNLGDTFYQVYHIVNSLVVTGKTINFILFCVSSEHFRRKCFVVLYRKFPQLSQSSLGRRFGGYARTSLHDQRASLKTVRSLRRSSEERGGRRDSSVDRERKCTLISQPSEPIEEETEHKTQHTQL